jgi:SnoaL-like domain
VLSRRQRPQSRAAGKNVNFVDDPPRAGLASRVSRQIGTGASVGGTARRAIVLLSWDRVRRTLLHIIQEGTAMDDESRRAGMRRLVGAINAREMEPFDAIYHDDVVIEWPQSGEVIRGKHNIRELRLARPTAQPTATLRRIIGSGDLWAAEMIFDYDGDRFYTVLIHEYRDGLVVRETCYYGPPFEAPDWRAQWVERAPSSVAS